LTELAGVPVDAKQGGENAEALGKRSPKTNAIARNPPTPFLCRRPCISAWMERGFLYRAEELVGRTGKQPDGSAKTAR